MTSIQQSMELINTYIYGNDDFNYSNPNLVSQIKSILNLIQTNDWTQPDCSMPSVKEGVVFKRSTLLKGQRRPSVKVKTKWWIEKLHSMYTEEECKILE
jgi:hypothetical protein